MSLILVVFVHTPTICLDPGGERVCKIKCRPRKYLYLKKLTVSPPEDNSHLKNVNLVKIIVNNYDTIKIIMS